MPREKSGAGLKVPRSSDARSSAGGSQSPRVALVSLYACGGTGAGNLRCDRLPEWGAARGCALVASSRHQRQHEPAGRGISSCTGRVRGADQRGGLAQNQHLSGRRLCRCRGHHRRAAAWRLRGRLPRDLHHRRPLAETHDLGRSQRSPGFSGWTGVQADGLERGCRRADGGDARPARRVRPEPRLNAARRPRP